MTGKDNMLSGDSSSNKLVSDPIFCLITLYPDFIVNEIEMD
jgi:hypothetical protein